MKNLLLSKQYQQFCVILFRIVGCSMVLFSVSIENAYCKSNHIYLMLHKQLMKHSSKHENCYLLLGKGGRNKDFVNVCKCVIEEVSSLTLCSTSLHLQWTPHPSHKVNLWTKKDQIYSMWGQQTKWESVAKIKKKALQHFSPILLILKGKWPWEFPGNWIKWGHTWLC